MVQISCKHQISMIHFTKSLGNLLDLVLSHSEVLTVVDARLLASIMRLGASGLS